MFFAIANDLVGFGDSLEEAMICLEDSYGGATLAEMSFYEGTEIQVELVVKQVPKKITSNK